MAVVPSIPFLFLLLTTFTIFVQTTNAKSAASTGTLVGEYYEVDIDDYVKGLGKWAVQEHNKEANDRLTYPQVFKAERQVVNGNNFRLNLYATRGGLRFHYKAIVHVPLGSNPVKKLSSFEYIPTTTPSSNMARNATSAASPGPIVGGYHQIDIDDYVKGLGVWAVQEHNKQANDRLTYPQVFKAERQVVNGFNYRLNLYATRGGLRFHFEAVVYVPLGNNPKKELSSFIYKRTTTPSTNKVGEHGATTDPVTALDKNVGQYTPIDNVKNNKEVQELGRLSVEEYNSRFNIGGHLSFVEVVEAKKQIVAGTNYYMYLTSTQNGATNKYDVYLSVPLSGKKKLTSFKPHISPAP